MQVPGRLRPEGSATPVVEVSPRQESIYTRSVYDGLMYIIPLIGIVLIVLAARRKRRRWNPNNFVTRIVTSMQLLTLASNTLLGAGLVSASDNEYRAISVRLTWALSDFTAGEGPITVGVALGDYSDTQIEQWLESSATMTRADPVAREQGNRMCRLVGTFPGILGNEVLNDGKPITTKLNWAIPSGSVVKLWAFNSGPGSLTTSAEVNATGRIFGRWT